MTLPITLLIWPLSRVHPHAVKLSELRRIAPEKVPLFALSSILVLITLLSQYEGSAVSELQLISVSDRLGNAVLSAGLYLVKTVWPFNLAAMYPHPALTGGIPWAGVSISAVLLTAITAMVIWQCLSRPYLGIGWA